MGSAADALYSAQGVTLDEETLMIDKKEELQGCLHYCPFDGDKDGPDCILRDSLVVSRKAHPQCIECLQPIPENTVNRVLVILDNHKVLTGRYCQACCEAMLSWVRDDNPKPLEERWELRDDSLSCPLGRPPAPPGASAEKAAVATVSGSARHRIITAISR